MQFQLLELADLKEIQELQPPEFPDIIPHIRYYIESPFCNPVKAIFNNKIVGTGTIILHKDTAWLAHIIVHPDFRNRGIGTMITRHLVDSVSGNSYQTVYLIATDLGKPVYEKIGFETETEYLFFKDGTMEAGIFDGAFIRPFGEKFSKDLFAIDFDVTGENRDWRLLEHIGHGYVFISQNKLEGYYLPTLGDGLIIANTTEAGIELMKRRLTDHTTAVLPIDNKQAIDFLNVHNYNQFRTAKRMRLGKKRKWEPGRLYNRIGGQIG